jgi:hypothetical protein
MAKVVKFNLICDNKAIRTLDNLRDNFCIEDILSQYRNGLLKKWLSIRGYDDLLKQVESIPGQDDIDVALSLIKIFEVEKSEEQARESICSLEYKKELQEKNKAYTDASFAVDSIVGEYFSGYQAIRDKIINNPNDISGIKAALGQIECKYKLIFSVTYEKLFEEFKEKAPLAIFVLLMRVGIRNYFIPSGEDVVKNPTTEKIYIELCKYGPADYKNILGNHLKVFKGKTNDYWKDIEKGGKEFMILNMEAGNFVRNCSKSKEELSSADISKKFVILNGIDYKSKNETQELLYVEV